MQKGWPKNVMKSRVLQAVSTKFIYSRWSRSQEQAREPAQVCDVAKPEQVKPTAIHLVSFVAVTTFRRVTAMNSSLQVETAPSTTTRTVVDLSEDAEFYINAVQPDTSLLVGESSFGVQGSSLGVP